MSEGAIKITLSESKYPSASADARPTDDLEYDLGNLLAYDPHPVSYRAYRSDPDHLLTTARDLTQLLVNRVFSLPSEPCDVGGRTVELPEGTTVVPRMRKMPVLSKAETRWEKFAREKGIRKRKRGAMEYDERTGEWLPRFGAKSAKNRDIREEWVKEVKDGEAWPSKDENPFGEAKKARKAVIDKQKKREARNKDEAAQTAGFTAMTERAISKAPWVLRSQVKTMAKQAFSVAQTSTASAGKFDKRVSGEKAPKDTRSTARRDVTALGGARGEKSRNMGVLDKLFSGDELINSDKAARMHMASSQSAVARDRADLGLNPSTKGKKRKGGAGVHKKTKGSTKRNRKK